MAVDPTVTAPRQPIVKDSDAWGHLWVVRPGLRCAEATLAASPVASTARLVYNYGMIDSGDGAGAAEVEPLDLLDRYVQILRPPAVGEDIAPIPIWYGLITALSDRLGAADADPIMGDQAYTARGLEFALDRMAVDGSYILTGSVTPAVAKIDRVLPFNYLADAPGLADVGNRSNAKYTVNGSSCYVFSDDGALWTFADIAEYLLAAFVPAAWRCTLGGMQANLNHNAGCMAPPRSVMAGLNEIFNRRRGHTWRPVVSASDFQSVEIRIDSCFTAPVTVHNVTIDPAASLIRLNPAETTGVTITQSSENSIDRIEARGAPILLLNTFRYSDSEIQGAWSAATETAYKAAGLGRAGDEYRHVYRSFRIPAASIPGGPRWIAPISEPMSAVWSLGKTFLPQIPLAANADDASGPVEYRPLMVAAQYDGGDGATWHKLDSIWESSLGQGPVNISVRPLAGELGVHVNPTPAYQLALNHYTPDNFDPDRNPMIDYETLLITAAWHSDAVLRAEATLPAAAGAAPAGRTLRIDVPDAELWIRLPDTVVDVSDGELVRLADTENLRDDSERLVAVCALAKAWYGRPRASAAIDYGCLVYHLSPGEMIEEIAYDTPIVVNTPITSVAWDFVNGATGIVTDFAELDFVQMAARAATASPFADRGSSLAAPAVATARDAGQPPPSGGSTFLAEITASAADGTNRFKYAWKEIRKSADAGYAHWTDGTLTGSTATDPARNWVENMNDSAGVQGNGVDIDGADFPAGFSLQAVPAGVIVEMHRLTLLGTATPEYWFGYENGIDGTCEAT